MPSKSVRLSGTRVALPPSFRISSSSSSSPPWVRATATTWAPALASARAVAWPMPREAPVTRAIREARRRVIGDLWYDLGPKSNVWEVRLTAYIAMLRGVNVGGNPLKMDWLRAACEEIGLRDVRTYVQSGNIVFTSRLGAAAIAQTLKATVDAQTRLPVSVVIRNAAELAKIVAGNPFLKQDGIDVAKLHITFLDKTPTKPPLERLDALAGSRDQYRL